MQASTAIIHGDEDLHDQEVVLSAPVQRIATQTEIKVPDLPPPKMDERTEPTWNDDEWGFIADPRQAGSWQKRPLYVGLLSVVLDLQLGLRIAAYSIGLAIVLSMIGRAAILAYFFQAEDGIRNRNVTGVQTCALPILLTDVRLLKLSNADLPVLGQLALRAPGTNQHSHAVGQLAEDAARAVGANCLLTRIGSLYRSEERRVGKL